MDTPILFTDYLSDNTPAVFVETSNPNAPRAIIINACLRLDPEFLTDTLVEEVIHAQQSLDGVDIQADKRRYSYKDSPLEQEAKVKSKAILGYAEEDTLYFQQHSERGEPSNLIDSKIKRPVRTLFRRMKRKRYRL